MDDMKEIENKMQIMAQGGDDSPAPLPAQVHSVLELDETVASIVKKTKERVNEDKYVDKRADDLAKVADKHLKNEIEIRNVQEARREAKNKTDRKEIANALYRLKEESKRIKKEQRHLSEMQKARHKQEKIHAFWETHKDTLELYKMREGSSRVACTILLWLDGVKCFFVGLSKVSDALVKALKYVLIFVAVFGAVMAIPVTRNWLLTILGFIKNRG